MRLMQSQSVCVENQQINTCCHWSVTHLWSCLMSWFRASCSGVCSFSKRGITKDQDSFYRRNTITKLWTTGSEPTFQFVQLWTDRSPALLAVIIPPFSILTFLLLYHLNTTQTLSRRSFPIWPQQRRWVPLLSSFPCHLLASRDSSLYPFSFSSSSPSACRNRLAARHKQCPDSSSPSSLRFQTLSTQASTAFLHTL